MLHITYCSKEKAKEEGKIPAVNRYKSERIREIRELSEEKGDSFAILSGKHGLLEPLERIEYYDKLMRMEDVPEIVEKVIKYLENNNVEQVRYHTKKIEGVRVPYYKALKSACDEIDVDLEIENISDN